jgi:hypothetical protein
MLYGYGCLPPRTRAIAAYLDRETRPALERACRTEPLLGMLAKSGRRSSPSRHARLNPDAPRAIPGEA